MTAAAVATDSGPASAGSLLLQLAEVGSWPMYKLEEYIGGLSSPSKMPGFSYGLPAAECKIGTELRKHDGSTCAGIIDPESGKRVGGCYAFERGMYRFEQTKRAQYRRLQTLGQPLWVAAMAELINRKAQPSRAGEARNPHFRWHDSGDLQSVEHLERIVQVCELSPSVQHWLPTREYRMVRDWISAQQPERLQVLAVNGGNLNIRMSAHMIGGHVPRFPRLPVTVSAVSTDELPAGAYACPAQQQNNECGSCRACWSGSVHLVSYHLH